MKKYRVFPSQLLLTCTVLGVSRWGGQQSLRLITVYNGRDNLPIPGINVARTVAPLASGMPVPLNLDSQSSSRELVSSLDNQVSESRSHAATLPLILERRTTGALRIQNAFLNSSALIFNYVGKPGALGQARQDRNFLKASRLMARPDWEGGERPVFLQLQVFLANKQFIFGWTYDVSSYDEETIRTINQHIKAAIEQICY